MGRAPRTPRSAVTRKQVTGCAPFPARLAPVAARAHSSSTSLRGSHRLFSRLLSKIRSDLNERKSDLPKALARFQAGNGSQKNKLKWETVVFFNV